MDLRPYIEKLRAKAAKLENELAKPEIYQNPVRLRQMSQEFARLRKCLDIADRLEQVEKAIADNKAALENEDDPELMELLRDEIQQLEKERKQLEPQIIAELLPPQPGDHRNTIVEIRAGAGGEESALFAADLYRMLTRYAERKGWKVEQIDASPSDLGGFKEVIFSVSGPEAYRRLKWESGVHRVQRIPVTESQGRIHTSTATVAVLPEAEEVEVEINPDDLEITVCRASGPGGQGVNTTDSAVQILHKPTGIIVRCADERSQQKNKAKALKVLRARLLDLRIRQEQAKIAAERRAQVGTGERNEKIRTYNFPQNRVTDHRIDLTLYNLPEILDGDLDPIIDQLIQHDLYRRLEQWLSEQKE